MVWRFGIPGVFEIRRYGFGGMYLIIWENMVHLKARFDAVRLARYDSVEWFST